MNLYLIRHGDYVLDSVQQLDVLTEKGTDDIKRLANFLSPLNLRVDQVLHSVKHRAQQTASLLARGFAYQGAIQSRAELGPNDAVFPFTEELEAEEEDLLVVGHLPFLCKLASQLLIGKEGKEIIHFQPGTLACLQRAEGGRWHILWVLSAEIV